MKMSEGKMILIASCISVLVLLLLSRKYDVTITFGGSVLAGIISLVILNKL